MRIYTKTGDKGETGLANGTRVGKDDVRVEAYGGVDELNSYLGLIGSEDLSAETGLLLEEIQADLLEIGADLATPGAKRTEPFLDARSKELETRIDALDLRLAPLRNFILPGGSRIAAHCHVARSICRRAERDIMRCARKHPLPACILVYMNRLSDLLFVLARAENAQAGINDPNWKPRQDGPG